MWTAKRLRLKTNCQRCGERDYCYLVTPWLETKYVWCVVCLQELEDRAWHYYCRVHPLADIGAAVAWLVNSGPLPY